MSIVQTAIERMKLRREAEPRHETPNAPAPREPKRGSTTALAYSDALAPIDWTGALSSSPIQIDRGQLQEVGLYPAPEGVQRQRDDFRAVRREIIAATRHKATPESPSIGPIAVVTSAMPGEGKSFTALNLALSIASEGTRDVLLIDADTVRHTISAALGLARAPGLMELLERPSENFRDYVRPTSIDRLRFMAAGARHEGASDLFSFSRVGPLFAAIKATLEGHIVIVDTAPIILSSDTPVLTDAAGQVLLVVRSGTTLRDSVMGAISRLKESTPVGIVLNDWDPVLHWERRAHNTYYDNVGG